jgi:phosphoribosylformylglycinamidine synthase
MEWRIEVRTKRKDSEAAQLLREIHDLGYPGLAKLVITRVYLLRGELARKDAERIAQTTFADPVTDRWLLRTANCGVRTANCGVRTANCEPQTADCGVRTANCELEVLYHPGVSDPSEASIKRAIRELGFNGVDVRSARRYRFIGRLTRRQIESVAKAILYNPLIQHIGAPDEQMFPPVPEYRFRRVFVEIIGKSARELLRISRQGQLALNLDEMRSLQCYFQKLGRNPTDVELETFAQTWSEHCKHKTFRGRTVLDGKVINNLFRQTIHRVTRELNRRWCLSVFKDNSGVIEFDKRFGITFKVETHNHPSALEPYGGAATGIGGVIRDCLGTGLGAKPILNTDVFCFARPDLPMRESSKLETLNSKPGLGFRTSDLGLPVLPAGVLHPKRILKGVVSGVRDYGNRMGIPTANGALYFHDDFRCNPLVFCGTLGIIPRNKLEKKIQTGDHIVVLGARTGRDGIHGVTFASLELNRESETFSSSAVQIGNPIEEKKLTDAMLKARDLNLFNATTDCGGGGLASAVGELAEPKGAVVDLDRVPLKYHGLSYTEIWISESQERQVILVPPKKLARLLKLCRSLDVEATSIGRITANKRLILRYQGNLVADLDLEFLHEGWSTQQRIARTRKSRHSEPRLPTRNDYTAELLGLLGSLNIASKEWVIRQYDHEVQGASVVKPFAGVHNAGPTDGCVLRPLRDSNRGVVTACGLNPRYGLIDPYNMAASAIDEALRNVTACGGDPARTALLDNFCWGNPERPEQLAGFVAAARACYAIAKGFGTPFISGKDSFYNEFRDEHGRLHPIPPTLLISAVSVIPDCRKTMTTDLKQAGSRIYLLGDTFNELGGSEYFARYSALGNRVPRVNVHRARELMLALSRAIRQGLVLACHDVSEGGLAVALAEMCFSGGIGAEVNLKNVRTGETIDRDDTLLFSESNSRFLVEVDDQAAPAFERVIRSFRPGPIGRTCAEPRLRIQGLNGCFAVDAALAEMETVWRTGLSRLL